MAKKKKEKVTEEVTQEQVDVKKEDNVTKVDLKAKEIEETVHKVDLSAPPPVEEKTDDVEDVKTNEEAEESVLEDITNEEVEEIQETVDTVEEKVEKSEQTTIEVPESVQGLLAFMEETGGDIQDYVALNTDYSDVPDKDLLRDYLVQTKPHLSSDEINFLMEDNFNYDEEVDEERDIRRKKLAFKEQVANARKHLDGLKSNYYREIKAGSRLTPHQQQALEFFNRYQEESQVQEEQAKQQHEAFTSKTNQVFNDKFKGFEYAVGEKKFRFNVKDANKVKETQTDVNNFFNKFVGKNGQMEDAKGYHKSLFTAMNPDVVANHFYEQGKADAVKDSMAKSKNIDMTPRQSHGEVTTSGGMKFKALDVNPSKYKFQIKNKLNT
tara:strand:- start:641 stop:1783 length:1143 start_codon:yes stop_codon:yes gene_type:complete